MKIGSLVRVTSRSEVYSTLLVRNCILDVAKVAERMGFARMTMRSDISSVPEGRNCVLEVTRLCMLFETVLTVNSRQDSLACVVLVIWDRDRPDQIMIACSRLASLPNRGKRCNDCTLRTCGSLSFKFNCEVESPLTED